VWNIKSLSEKFYIDSFSQEIKFLPFFLEKKNCAPVVPYATLSSSSISTSRKIIQFVFSKSSREIFRQNSIARLVSESWSWNLLWCRSTDYSIVESWNETLSNFSFACFRFLFWKRHFWYWVSSGNLDFHSSFSIVNLIFTRVWIHVRNPHWGWEWEEIRGYGT
jgi:hypothetical protein